MNFKIVMLIERRSPKPTRMVIKEYIVFYSVFIKSYMRTDLKFFRLNFFVQEEGKMDYTEH